MADRTQLWSQFLTVAVVALAARGVSLIVPFQFDDLHQIAQNPALRDPTYLPRLFTDPWIGSTTGHTFFYRPILFVTFLWDGLVGGGNPVPYRVTSLLLFVGLALLVGRFARELLARLLPGSERELVDRAGFLASLLVAVHPLFNESLLLATGRSSLLMAVWGMSALLLLVRGGGRAGRDVAMVGLTILALLTKETAVVLAPLSLLVVWVARSGLPTGRRLIAAWPVVVPALVYAGLYWGATRQGWFFDPAPEAFPRSLRHPDMPWERPAVGLLSLIGLARLALVPVGLSLIHPVSAASGLLRAIAPPVWILGTVGVVYLLRRKAAAPRLVGFAALWFGLALAPIVTAGLNMPMAEHRVVLAMVGVTVAAGYGLASIRPARLARVAAFGLVIVLAAGSVLQSVPWRSQIALWEYEARRHPASDRPWGFLAAGYQAVGDLSRARGAIERALELSPGNVLHLTRATDLAMLDGDLPAAGRYAAAGLAVDSAYASLLRLETERLARLGRLGEALTYAQRGVAAVPRSSASWNALGNVQYLMGDRRALDSYRRALVLDSGNTEAARNLEMASQRWGG